MTAPKVVDRDAIVRDPRFMSLPRRKTTFLWGLMAVSVAYYFLLPVGTAYFQDLFKIRVWGVVNVVLLFALSEFVVAWAIAFTYSRKASRDFDWMTADIATDFGAGRTVREEPIGGLIGAAIAASALKPLFELKNPGLISILLGFPGVILGSLLFRDRRAEQMWNDVYARQNGGLLVSKAVAL
jgi:uncharacterized membrane protein (DUF485 family)